jgi:hypothetical protein
MSRDKIATKAVADATSPTDQVFLITRVPLGLHTQVKRYACDHRMTIQKVVSDAIEALLRAGEAL